MSPTWWQGIALGLVQGLTEFLPVSSSGHLVVAEALLDFQSAGVAFEVALHLATLLSVVIVYREAIQRELTGLVRRDPAAWRLAGLLLLASVPAAVVGIGFKPLVERAFDSLTVVGLGFLATAAALWTSRRAPARDLPVTARTALLIGLAQAVAVLPGVSRSGSTIVVALWCGLAPARAAEFSFLMAVIVIAGSGVLEARHLEGMPMSAGFLLAFLGALVSGVFAIRFLVWLLRRAQFHRFAGYVAAVGILTLLWAGLAR